LKKRGQTTTFIAIGILLLITIGMLLYIRGLYYQTTEIEVEKIHDQPTTLPPLKSYIQECIVRTSQRPLEEIGKNGGVFNKSINGFNRRYTKYRKKDFYSMCQYVPGDGCVNTMVTRPIIESEIARNMTERLQECINLSVFENIGYTTSNGSMKINVTVAVSDIDIVLHYPVRIEKLDDVQEEDTFQVLLPVPLGKMFDLMVQIVNTEVTYNQFDKNLWMLQHGSEVTIKKERVYPHTLYTLTSKSKETNNSYQFLFSTEGQDRVSMIGGTVNLRENTSRICYSLIDGTCYNNTPRLGVCTDYGLNDSGPGCSGLTTFGGANQGLNPCLNATGHVSLPHGWQACVEDAPGGVQGADRAGTRYTLMACINGIMYFEACRDYREEYCTYNPTYNITLFNYNSNRSSEEGNYTIFGKGICKENRWEDCLAQRRKNDCENENYRDCKWDAPTNYGINTSRPLCIPKVPPGFKYWENNGIQACEMGNDYRTCDGLDFSCPYRWHSNLDKRCSGIGDCGNGYSVNGKLSTQGFFSTDSKPYSKYNNVPENYTLYDGTFAQVLTVNAINFDQSKLERRKSIYSTNEYFIDEYTYSDVVTFLTDYIEDVATWDMCGDWFDCIWNVIPKKYTGYVAAGAICMPWKASDDFNDMECQKCSTNAQVYPCTEYKCRSYGEGCNFYYDTDGMPICTSGSASDVSQFNFTYVNVTNGYNTSEDVNDLLLSMDYIGMQINESLQPNLNIVVSFNTSEETKCTLLGYPPELLAIPGFPVMSQISGVETSYSKEHHLDVTLPDITDLMNYTSSELNLHK